MPGMDLSYFRAEGESLVPSEISRSSWKHNQMHGVAVSGALARAAERCLVEVGRTDLRPARMTVDLFRPATMDPCHLLAQVERQGPRICLVDVMLTQNGVRVARSSALFLKPTESAPGDVWSPAPRFQAPPEDVVPPSDEPRVPFLYSGQSWSQDFGTHQNGAPKQSWSTGVPVVAGEVATPFQAVAAIADGASLITNLGSQGVQHINTDISLALAREPVGLEIGLAALDRIEVDGIAVATAAVFDRKGPLGNVMMTSLSNAKRTIDFESVAYADDGQRVARGSEEGS